MYDIYLKFCYFYCLMNSLEYFDISTRRIWFSRISTSESIFFFVNDFADNSVVYL